MVQQVTTRPIVRDTWVPMSYEEWLDWAPEGTVSEWVDGKGMIFLPASQEHQWSMILLYNLD